MRALGPRAWWLPEWLDRRIPQIEHGDGQTATEPAPEEIEVSPVQRLDEVAHAEHRQLLDLLTEIETAHVQRQPQRVIALVRELRRLAELHFRYEQRALFPQLVATLGADYVEGLYITQESVVEALGRIEFLAESAEIHESAATETSRLLRSARAGVITCDSLSEVVERQPPEVAERVLAAREQVLTAVG
jgi:hypothetical protein